jgi:hypothetical protein
MTKNKDENLTLGEDKMKKQDLSEQKDFTDKDIKIMKAPDKEIHRQAMNAAKDTKADKDKKMEKQDLSEQKDFTDKDIKIMKAPDKEIHRQAMNAAKDTKADKDKKMEKQEADPKMDGSGKGTRDNKGKGCGKAEGKGLDIKKDKDFKEIIEEKLKGKFKAKKKDKDKKKKGKFWVSKDKELKKANYNGLGQWELKKNESDSSELSYKFHNIYEEVLSELNKNDEYKAILMKNSDSNNETLIKTAIYYTFIDKLDAEKELKKSRDNAINTIDEILEKSKKTARLFEKEQAENVNPSDIEIEAPSKKESFSRDLEWRIKELKDLIDLKYTIEAQYLWGDFKDESTYKKIKKAMEYKYDKIRKEIKDLAVKFNNAKK